MSFKEWFKNYWFRLKIFIWYVFTEPIRQLCVIQDWISVSVDTLNKLTSWMWICLISGIILLYIGEKKYASMLLSALLLAILLWEWDRGFFMKRYREKYMQKIKEVEENEIR